ncbi:immune inhibitor A domain-containing protein [Colwellia hornerae]|uniref:M6 family metalloprotease domain-containing protein n=1 Tax=Colwellia hornerae TaxID=89402 RepID=A0A5C6QCA3_9GAMM|nr:immune inhibitor A domain-containing protein [Colwellia hornerae]TWX58484.1 M6 family metalloprotease domain-containing protein [Colwellia hornerae]TWX58720.1 M6 family metalloprotease domain-containing protein [Colwellia hornerae]TWX66596.1 M6 family metalloprotease domain-containing protein [Colwellia hornerae]
MKIPYLLALLVLIIQLPLRAENIDNTKRFSKSAPADAGVINKERILYWLEKRGELSINATEEQKKQALTDYLIKKSFKPKALPLALSKKVVAAERFSSGEFRQKMSFNHELKKTQIAHYLLQETAAADVETTVKVLAILIDFNDLKHNDNGLSANDTDMFYSSYSVAHYNDLLFSAKGFDGPSGQNIESAFQYYQHESGQQFFFTGQVKGWVTAENNASYYGSNDEETENDQNVKELVVEAVTQLVAEGIDLSAYDKTDLFDFDGDGNVNEPDGIIDHIMLFHASIGEEAGGGNLAEDAIWSHRSFVLNETGDQPATIPGSEIKAFGYTINPIDAAPGVVVHEFGHDLGLLDEYDIDSSDIGAPVSEWSVMASGTWLGSPAGTRPSAFSPLARDYLQERYQGNWITQREVDFASLSTESISLVSTVDHTAINQIKVNLPPLALDFPAAYAGTYQFYSNKGDMMENSMSFSANLPTGTSILSMKARWEIEQDYDYVQVLVNNTAIKGNYSQNSNPYYPSIGEYISGNSADIVSGEGDLKWADLTFDLASFAGQSVVIKINYVTDQAEGGYGFVADEIKVTNGVSEVIAINGETENQATLAGFSRLSDKIAGLAHYYYVQLRSHTSVDSRLNSIGYDAGVLLWYRNDNVADNKVDEHAGQLFIGVVDADQNLVKAGDGSSKNSAYQIHDAAFSLYDQQPFNGDVNNVATSFFSDADDHSSPGQPESGVILPKLDFSMKVDLQSSDSTSATVTLSSSSEASDLSVSFSYSANDLVVNFTSVPVGGDSQYSYAWDFDDNSSSNIQNPSHTYTQAGSYSVELTVMDSTGLSVKTTKSITVSKTAAVVVIAPSKVKSSDGGAISFALLLGLCLLRIIRK